MEVVYPQLWIFDFDCCTWTCVEPVEGGKKRGNATSNGNPGGGGSGGGGNKSIAGPGPPAVFDHTATLSGGKHIIVIGGVMVGTALNSQVRFSRSKWTRPPVVARVVLAFITSELLLLEFLILTESNKQRPLSIFVKRPPPP